MSDADVLGGGVSASVWVAGGCTDGPWSEGGVLMTETRTGLCLGGPKDGQMLAFDSEYFHCYETPISFRTILDRPMAPRR